MDRTETSGVSDAGSIPARGTSEKSQRLVGRLLLLKRLARNL